MNTTSSPGHSQSENSSWDDSKFQHSDIIDIGDSEDEWAATPEQLQSIHPSIPDHHKERISSLTTPPKIDESVNFRPVLRSFRHGELRNLPPKSRKILREFEALQKEKIFSGRAPDDSETYHTKKAELLAIHLNALHVQYQPIREKLDEMLLSPSYATHVHSPEYDSLQDKAQKISTKMDSVSAELHYLRKNHKINEKHFPTEASPNLFNLF
jgi:chaperonin cofactor prefoldin